MGARLPGVFSILLQSHRERFELYGYASIRLARSLFFQTFFSFQSLPRELTCFIIPLLEAVPLQSW